MPQIYKLFTAILAFTGCTSLIITGELNYFLSLVVLGLLPGYYRSIKEMPPAPKWAISSLSVITLIILLIDSLLISNDIFIAIAHLTITFQAIKGFDLKDVWDHLQVFFMSILQLVIASELTHSIIFGVIFVLFLFAFVAAMILSHFIKEGIPVKIEIKKTIVSISIITILITVIFFLSTPRIAGGLWGKSYQKSIKTAGFSENVNFGSFGDVINDSTIIMRVELSEKIKKPYYWRGISLKYFDGVSWKNTFLKRRTIYSEDGIFSIKPYIKEKAMFQKIYLEPMDNDVIFGLTEIVAIEAKVKRLITDDTGAFYFPAKSGKRFHYNVYSINKIPQNIEDINGYLQLPAGVEDIYLLALKVTDRIEKDYDKAYEIEKYLKTNYTYSLSVTPPPSGMSPIQYFLFKSKKGYCEHYATAMVLMLRTLGIPTRIVNGFAGGELNEYGGYIIVRQKNAHSWVEAVIDGQWKQFDPTPSILTEEPSSIILMLDSLKMKWYRYVIGFSALDQKDIVRFFSEPFLFPRFSSHYHYRFNAYLYFVFFAAVFLGLIIFLMRFLKIKHSGFITREYIILRKIIKKRGGRVTYSTTSSELLKEAEKMGIDGKLYEFINIYSEVRFGRKEMTEEGRSRYRSLLTEIKKQFIK